MRDALEVGRPRAAELLATLRLMADIAREMWEHTDFGMLYDPTRGLFSIGYNTAEARLDASYYDLLASECRLASFLAVAKDDVPQSHWFRLGRTLAATDAGYVLISWSASMFEYLMPLLVMHSYPATLMADTYESVVRRQEQYGAERGVPWGVSESAFNAKDSDLTYQYQAFGVPGLGLKRGLSEDLVIAPYASALALMVASASTSRWITRPDACPREPNAPWSRRTSPTIRAWRSRPPPTCCRTSPCSAGSTRTRSCARPTCSCRSRYRATSP